MNELKPCVSDRLARGTDTSRPAGSSGEDGVAEVVESCRRQKVFGEAFADSIGERAGRELSATESECLAGGLADLTPDEVDLVLASGVNPQVPGGAELIERVTSGCGVEVDR